MSFGGCILVRLSGVEAHKQGYTEQKQAYFSHKDIVTAGIKKSCCFSGNRIPDLKFTKVLSESPFFSRCFLYPSPP
jgi:hypothetical protein